MRQLHPEGWQAEDVQERSELESGLKAVGEDLWCRMAAELLAKEHLGRLLSFQTLLRHG